MEGIANKRKAITTTDEGIGKQAKGVRVNNKYLNDNKSFENLGAYLFFFRPHENLLTRNEPQVKAAP